MSEWLEEIDARLELGLLPDEDEVGRLVRYCRDRDRAIETLADATITFFSSTITLLEQRVGRVQRPLPPGEFYDLAGQHVDH